MDKPIELGLKNSLIHHANNFGQLASVDDSRLGKYAASVKLLISIAIAVGNGLKNEVDADVLANAIDEKIFGKEDRVGADETEITDILKEMSEKMDECFNKLSDTISKMQPSNLDETTIAALKNLSPAIDGLIDALKTPPSTIPTFKAEDVGKTQEQV